ncbi:MAG TPA: hypothetical protein VEI58_12205 [Chthoniobacterales bacterium]|nr:hypothetical protein [Chthoniobacterales bacterium]
MKLEEAKKAFYDASATLTENTRKLCFAGIAIVWIFKVGDKNAGGVPFAAGLLWPLGAFVMALALDVLQYFYKSTIWWLYYACKHKQGTSDDSEIDPPRLINFLTFVFFYGKVLFCGYGFYRLLAYIWKALA